MSFRKSCHILFFLLPVALFGVSPRCARGQAQQIVRGVVVDATTGETLPAASIQVDGTLRGTISNAEGQFAIEVDSLPAELVARFIGYAPAKARVEQTEGIRLALKPMVYMLEEVVVSGEDPAVRIMREVIRRKQTWRAALDTYQADAYNRFTMQNDTGIVSIMESATRAFWSREQGMREVVLANRRTNNLDVDQYLPAARFMANFYDDNIDIAGYNFVGVTHPDALKHYDFTLTGTWRQGEDTVFDIKVEPKNRFKTAFVGRLSVLDGAFAMLDVALVPNESFLFPPPIQEFRIAYEQQFADFDGAFWLPVDLRARMSIEISLMRLLSFPAIEINQVTRLTNYATNVPLPDSLYEKKDEMVVDSASVQSANLVDLGVVKVTADTGGSDNVPADTTALDTWIVPLTRAEAAAYESIDSTMTMEKAFKPTGAMARFVDMDDDEDEGKDAGTGRKGLGIAFTPALHYNRVEELYGGLKASRTWGSVFTLRGGAGYATGPDKGLLSYNAGIGLAKGRAGIDVDVAKGVASVQGGAPLALTANGLIMLMGGYDYYDYYLSEGIDIAAHVRPTRRRLLLTAGLTSKAIESLPTVTDYNLFGNDRIQPPNPGVVAVDDDPAGRRTGGNRSSLWASVKYGDTDQTFGVTGRRFVELGAEWSQEGFLDSGIGFTRYWLDAEWQIPTLFQRRILSNQLHLRTVAFATAGDAPLWSFGSLDSRMGVVSPYGRFKTLPGRPYTAQAGLALLWEHNFRTFFFEMLGWHRVAQKGYGVIVFGGHGKTWDPDGRAAQAYGPMYGANQIHEVGVSLSGLFSLFRLDAAFRIDKPGFTVGLGAARLF
ncbi:MAG: DUF5686 family protein [Rhodothermales bacterium]